MHIEKKEEKNKSPIESLNLNDSVFLSSLERIRKIFWVENLATRRLYHISLDYCNTSQDSLYQMEIEYTGTYVKRESVSEQEIVDDIAILTHLIMKRFPELKRTTLSKQEWLGIRL